jgi:hypothetical protein
MTTQERILNEMSQLVGAVNRLVNGKDACRNGLSNDINMSRAAITDAAPDDMAPETAMLTTAVALQEVQLGYEIDRCSGQLRVQDRYGEPVRVDRGEWKSIDVAIDGNGYWYWSCGDSSERSRGAPNFRQRVKRLKVWHSGDSRKITWWCYDLL